MAEKMFSPGPDHKIYYKLIKPEIALILMRTPGLLDVGGPASIPDQYLLAREREQEAATDQLLTGLGITVFINYQG